MDMDLFNSTASNATFSPSPLCDLKSVQSSYAYATVLILIAVISTTENGVVLVAISKYKALRTPSLLLIGALAFVDFLTGCIVTPLYAVITINPDVPWQKANRILMVVVVLLSLITVVYISFDRFLHVYYLQSYRVTRKKLCIGLLFFWIAPFAFHSLVRVVVNKKFGREAGRAAARKSAVAVIAMCIIIMVFAYGGIIFMLKRHATKVSDSIRQKYLENQTRAAKTAFVIVAVVIAMNSLAMAYSMMKDTSSVQCAITLVSLLGNSVVNPLVYCFRLPLMKKHLLMMLCRKQGEGDEEFRDRMLTRTSSMTTNLAIDHNVSLKGIVKGSVKGVNV